MTRRDMQAQNGQTDGNFTAFPKRWTLSALESATSPRQLIDVTKSRSNTTQAEVLSDEMR